MTTRITSRPRSGTIGRSRKRARQASTVSRSTRHWRYPQPRSCPASPQLQQATEHHDADQDCAAHDCRKVGVQVEECHVAADQRQDQDRTGWAPLRHPDHRQGSLHRAPLRPRWRACSRPARATGHRRRRQRQTGHSGKQPAQDAYAKIFVRPTDTPLRKAASRIACRSRTVPNRLACAGWAATRSPRRFAR